MARPSATTPDRRFRPSAPRSSPRARFDLGRGRRGWPLQGRHHRCGGERSRRDAAALQPNPDLADRHVDLGEPELGQQGAEAPRELDGRALARIGLVAAPRHQEPAVATRPRYSPVRVSTLTTSPSLRNNGTLTTAPVSRVAGFVPPWAVSPRTPGSVLAIASSTKLGSSTAVGEPAM